MEPQTADMMIGQTIGNYLVTQKLGEGGMGSVYLAEHPHIGKKVALKVLHNEFSANQEVVGRFFNEAKAVNDIQHPNIVDIVDYGMIQAGGGRDQLVYFIMEYLAGTGLSNTIRGEGAMAPERALSIALQVGDALAASHKCGIVHRDLKPDNIILVTRGRERDFVKLLDFGIAKLTGDQHGSSRTRTGIVMGTPAYMSPEQCEGRGNVDHRTDIYALGIVLYEMLTARVPFIGEGYGEILVQHLTQVPIAPSQYHMMPAHVEAVVMKALEKRPENRYPTMDEMIRAMADPVGYVEAHGGVAGFAQRVLMPSTAPMPMPVRMTPTPAPLTPVPGSIPGYSSHHNTPAPTTLGAAAGQVQSGGGRKMGFVLAGVAIVAAAAVAIVVVTRNGGGSTSPSVSPGSDVANAGSGSAGSAGGATMPSTNSGSAGSAGSATMPVVATGSGSAVAATGSGSAVAAGSGSATAATGSGSAVVASGSGSATVAAVGSAGSGSATTPTTTNTGGAGSGSATTASIKNPGTGSASPGVGSAAPPPVPTTWTVKLGTNPDGAEIFLGAVDTNKVTTATPSTLEVPRAAHGVHIVLKKSHFQDVDKVITQDSDLDVIALKPVAKSPGTKPPVGPTTKPPGTKPKPHGGGDGGDLMRPEDM